MLRGTKGFTLIELMVAVVILAVVAGAAFLVLNSSAKAKRTGDNMAEAQQNARSAMNVIVADLRRAGYGVLDGAGVPIEVASDYRITVVIDGDRDNVVDPGERITYFVDPEQDQQLTSNTNNPFDYVIRRVESTVGDPAATPATGTGRVIAYLITQRSDIGATGMDVPLFSFFDEDGTTLTGTATDPAGTEYGTTLPDSLLGLPLANNLDVVVSRIDVNLVTETSAPQGNDAHYRQFALTIAFSVGISSINALTLSPALCAALLRKTPKKQSWFFRKFNQVFEWSRSQYLKGVRWFIKAWVLVLLVLTWKGTSAS